MKNQNLKFKTSLENRTYNYSVKTINFLEKLPQDISSQVIVKQLLRSATSVGANIVEAQASSSKKDFTNFLHHSLKSACESLYWLRLLEDAKHINNLDLNYLLTETQELANILAASILTIKGKR